MINYKSYIEDNNTKFKVTLLKHDSLEDLFFGYRICTDSIENISPEKFNNNIQIVKSALNSNPPHNSPLKHLIYKFYIQGIPRSLLQELVRHQIGVSINVKSTRFTLHKMIKEYKKLLEEETYGDKNYDENVFYNFVDKYFFLDPIITERKVIQDWYKQKFQLLHKLVELKKQNYKNDTLKQFLTEDLRTDVYITISSLALKHLLLLRLHSSAWKPFRQLCQLIVKCIPKEHLFLYENILIKYDINTNIN